MLPEPSLSTWSIIFLIVAAQGIFLALLLAVFNRGNATANRIMAIFVAAFSLSLCYYVLFWTGYSCNFMWTKGWCSAFPFLFGPLMFLYISVIRNGDLPANYRLHFIPFAIHLTYMLPFIYWFTTGPEVIAASGHPVHMFLQRNIYGHIDFVTTSFKVFNGIQFASMFVYAGLLIRLLIKERIKRNESTFHKTKYQWSLRNISFYALFAVLFSSYWISLWMGIHAGGLDYLVSGMMSLCIYLIGYSAFRQPLSLFEQKNGTRKKQLNSQQLKHQTQQLLHLLETEKPWLDSELNLNKLAEMMQLPLHELSFIINHSLGKNFADLMHSYRIREACRLLLEDSYAGSKILSIAFDVGYTNKATFNAAFKNITGLSPTAFRQSAKNREFGELLN